MNWVVIGKRGRGRIDKGKAREAGGGAPPASSSSLLSAEGEKGERGEEMEGDDRWGHGEIGLSLGWKWRWAGAKKDLAKWSLPISVHLIILQNESKKKAK